MFQHDVYFWLKDGLTDAERDAFRASLQTLRNIAVIERVVIGTPVPSERAVVDSSFSFSLHVTFQDAEAHDQYQVDPLHTAFVADNNAKWTRVQVYDSEVE